MARTDWKNKLRFPSLETSFSLAVCAALAILVFATQNRVVGWEPGYNELQSKHHGWVSSHTLAIIAHATPSNGFVGYAEARVDETGRRQYGYFDRYPVFFSAAMHALLSLKERLSTQIYLAKQAMNGVFLLTVVAAFLLLRRLTGRTLPSLASALLSVSSPYLLFYKDMIHYDQPALLGMLILIYAIALFKTAGHRWPVYAAAIGSVSLGRGYASFSVLGLWALLEALPILTVRSIPFPQRLARLIRSDALRVLALGIAWGAACLGYNIAVESIRRGVPFGETSIVLSAVNRLSLNEAFNESYFRILNWSTFLRDQAIRIVRWSFPVWEYEGSAALSGLLVLGMLAVIGLQGRFLDAPRRVVLWLLAFSGIVWLLAMRNLSAFHDYTAMYYLGVPLAFYATLTFRLPLPRVAWVGVVAAGLALFAVRHQMIQELHTQLGQSTNAYTHDFMRIAAALPGPGQTITLEDGVPYAPYAFGFYLPDDLQAPRSLADYVISRDPRSLPANLTPDNTYMYLLEK
jgi:hypothetical protein